MDVMDVPSAGKTSRWTSLVCYAEAVCGMSLQRDAVSLCADYIRSPRQAQRTHEAAREGIAPLCEGNTGTRKIPRCLRTVDS